MSETTKTLKDAVYQYRSNPQLIQRHSLDLLERIGNGEQIPLDPGNPFVFMLEAGAVNAAMAVDHSEAIARRIYPEMATEPADLYRHMSDVDYLNRFASPATTTYTIWLNVSEVRDTAVPVPGARFRKLTIPRNTIFNVNDTDFALHYPLDIRVMAHGNLQVLFDGTDPSPLGPLTNNRLNWNIVRFNGNDLLQIEVPVYQYSHVTHTVPISEATGFNQSFPFTDQFYYARVYAKGDDDIWSEVTTTHSEAVYDPTRMTATLKVLENELVVGIPQIYLTNRQIAGELRVDIFTTKGEITMNMSDYPLDGYKHRFRDFDGTDNGRYTTPLSGHSLVATFSTSTLTGGTNGVSFLEMRERVINSRIRKSTPTTYDDLKVAMNDRGYTLVKSVDNVTDRIFLAVRPMPSMANRVSPAGCLIDTVSVTDKSMAGGQVRNHVMRTALLPDNVYEMTAGTITRLGDDERERLLSMPLEEKVATFNDRQFLYSPYHYVLDRTDGRLTAMGYSMKSPEIKGLTAVEENMLSEYRIGSEDGKLTFEDNRWIFRIYLRVSENVANIDDSDIHVQLSFIPDGDSRPVYLNGTIERDGVGDRFIRFVMDTDFDISRQHMIDLKGFRRHLNDTGTYPTPLTGKFQLSYGISGHPEIERDANTARLNAALGTFELPDNIVALALEEYTLKLGQPLEGLLNRTRTASTPRIYERWETDVPETYSSTEFERDEFNNIVLATDSKTGRLGPVVKHNAGDPVLDEAGQPVIKYRKGTVKHYGDTNAPNIIEERNLERFIDMFLMDGKYLLVNDTLQVEYRDFLPDSVVDYLNQDISDVQERLLERTEMYLVPKRSLGQIVMVIDDNVERTLSTHQSMSVQYYLTDVVYRDNELREAIQLSTTEVILEWLKGQTLTLADLTGMLLERMGNDIVSVTPHWTGQLEGVSAVTPVDPSTSITVGQSLKLSADGSLQLTDNIEIEFIRHLA